MKNNGAKKMLRIYCLVLYVLFLISWLFLVSRDYLLNICQLNLEKSSNLIGIWAQLSPVPKFLTIAILYITIHAFVVGIIKITGLKKQKKSSDFTPE